MKRRSRAIAAMCVTEPSPWGKFYQSTGPTQAQPPVGVLTRCTEFPVFATYRDSETSDRRRANSFPRDHHGYMLRLVRWISTMDFHRHHSLPVPPMVELQATGLANFFRKKRAGVLRSPATFIENGAADWHTGCCYCVTAIFAVQQHRVPTPVCSSARTWPYASFRARRFDTRGPPPATFSISDDQLITYRPI